MVRPSGSIKNYHMAIGEGETQATERSGPTVSDGNNGNNGAKAGGVASLRQWLRALLPRRGDSTIKEAIEEAIEEVLEEREEDGDAETLPPEEKTLLHNALAFGDKAVHDIMTPRTDIDAVPCDIAFEDLKRHIVEQRHTRTPIYRETLDKVEGFVHIKDLFAIAAGNQPYDLKRMMRPMIFVPPSMKIIDLLVKMRQQGSHMAIVVDEYGGTDGLVTLEDLFEEIVGDIQDEHDEGESPKELVRVRDGLFEADARVRIEKLESALGVSLLPEQEDEEFDTLGGLIFFHIGRVPARGESIAHSSGIVFEVLDADPRRIKRVRIIQKA